MKLSGILTSIAAAALLAPAVCFAEDQPPQGEPPNHPHGGFGGQRENPFASPEFKKLADEYKANPSDELKAKIRAKIIEIVDKRISELKERLEKLQANRDKEIDGKLDALLSGKQEEPKDKGKHKPPNE